MPEEGWNDGWEDPQGALHAELPGPDGPSVPLALPVNPIDDDQGE